jgi:hypothetical protein
MNGKCGGLFHTQDNPAGFISGPYSGPSFKPKVFCLKFCPFWACFGWILYLWNFHEEELKEWRCKQILRWFHRLSINRPTKRAKENSRSYGLCQCEKEMEDHLLAHQ